MPDLKLCYNEEAMTEEQLDEIRKVRKAYKDEIIFDSETKKSTKLVELWDTAGFTTGRGHLKNLSSAEQVESLILSNANWLEPRLEEEVAPDYCTHCRADLSEYPAVTYCPECGKRPKPLE
ncbi:hypothetical protein EKH57_00265 (plasmid) [Halorubrum sp. BOL3-1]|uniref:hypothetical protein n=1 Tax=Halorubrum sp. BOL3-1 TaxID=2497325 RepID=UPI001004DB4F|nr:hypothetical protein [Halorubrum sp. BOL3-1]QAU11359.1 hypothetical protein EKH57_00265 [Halorubrum sp. BOL3-1]